MDKSLDGLHHVRNAEDSDQSLEVIGEDMQAHLGLHALQAFTQEMRCPIQALMVPYGCSTVHGRIRMASRVALDVPACSQAGPDVPSG